MSNQIKELAQIFLVRAYFDISKGVDLACVNRAYRDMNRTLRNFHPSAEERIKNNELERYRKAIREAWHKCFIVYLRRLKSIVFTSQEEFDNFHQSFCEELALCSKFNLTVGQSQKWINMTVKYLVILNDKDVMKNIQYFHIPVDAQIMKALSKKLQIFPFTTVWSQIEDYSIYLDYQKVFRDKIKGDIPLIKEFELFNSILEEKEY